MKNWITLFIFFFTVPFYAQVGIGTTSPNSSSALEISSTTKGFLPPRMTLSERNSISSPTAGLMIWCSNCGSGQIQVYDGNGWTRLLPFLAIGDTYGGGKVAYIFQPGDPGYVSGEIHGLIAAPSDQSDNAVWGCYTFEIMGADGTALGTGNQNTIDIVNQCGTAGIAARLCYDLVIGGYSDWYLPSRDELNKLYLSSEAIGIYNAAYYWSSSELGGYAAYKQFLPFHGWQLGEEKSISMHVRAVRTF